MDETKDIWFRIGYALERARTEPPAGRLRGLLERLDGGRGTEAKDERPPRARQRSEGARAAGANEALDALLTAGAGALAARLLGLVPARSRPGPLALFKAGASGAGAAFLRELLDPLLRGRLARPRLGSEVTDALLAGAVRGLLYGAVLEPRLPGPAVLRGVVYGSAEYAVSPWGGLSRLMGAGAPHRRFPLLAALSEQRALGEDSYLDHVVFGVALALFYRSAEPEASSGISSGT